MPSFQQIVANVSGSPIRKDHIAGREYLVYPMAMITEGVHEGNNGPLYYSGPELKQSANVWNHKPIVVYHPKRDGVHVSACEPDMLTAHQVGLILNSQWDDRTNKLRAEAWLEEHRLDTVDPRVMEDLKANRMIEVSTGLFTDNVAEEGTWNSEDYIAVAKNLRPDHLAILPDQKGACSIEDGAGLLQVNEALKKTCHAIEAFVLNEVSHDQVRDKLWALIRKEYGEAWVSEVYEEYLIYELGGKLYKLPYSMNGDEPTLGSDPQKVDRVVEYRPATTTVNEQGATGDETMTKAQMVDALIANKASGFTEKNKTTLLAFGDDQVKTLYANAEKAKEEPKKEGEGDGKTVEPPAQGAGAGGANTQPGSGTPKTGSPEGAVADDVINKIASNNAAPKQPTLNEWLQSAPPEVRGIVNNSIRFEQASRQRLISQITANSQRWTEDKLKNLPTELLTDLAAEVSAKTQGESQPQPMNSYAGLGFGFDDFQANAAGPGEDEGLDLPTTRPTVNEEA